MHVHFIAIGGAGIGPLAQIAKKAGYEVSGSDIQSSSYIEYLRDHGIEDIYIGQDVDHLDKLNKNNPIDWVVYSSALTMIDKSPPVLKYCEENNIKFTKRDEFINSFIKDKNLKMIAIAGTHGKTTTTAMSVWLFKQFNKPISYLLPAKVNYGEMGEYDPNSEYFVYEADEFDRNFLAFNPYISIISGVTYDHQEIYPTVDEYKKAFKQFILSSEKTYIWNDDADYLDEKQTSLVVLDTKNDLIDSIKLKGKYNRLDAFLTISSFSELYSIEIKDVIRKMNDFPGLSRRMEKILPRLYTDYAHTPEKIRGAMSVVSEMAKQTNSKVIVLYEPLTNRRQHFMIDQYKDCFSGAYRVYWLPSYLAREDPNQQILSPEMLISRLADPSIAVPSQANYSLRDIVLEHLNKGDMVVAMAGGGGGSLDDWIRLNFTE